MSLAVAENGDVQAEGGLRESSRTADARREHEGNVSPGRRQQFHQRENRRPTRRTGVPHGDSRHAPERRSLFSARGSISAAPGASPPLLLKRRYRWTTRCCSRYWSRSRCCLWEAQCSANPPFPPKPILSPWRLAWTNRTEGFEDCFRGGCGSLPVLTSLTPAIIRPLRLRCLLGAPLLRFPQGRVRAQVAFEPGLRKECAPGAGHPKVPSRLSRERRGAHAIFREAS